MDETARLRVVQHYTQLPDESLLGEFHLGPESYRDRSVWDAIAAEVLKRGLRTATDVAAVAHLDETAAAAIESLFCGRCRAATSPVSSGSTHITLVNFVFPIGDYLLGRSDECPTCGSYVARLWVLFGLPLIPLSRYRVVELGDRQFVSRKIVAA